MKNLPRKITEEKFREVFSAKGEITDARLIFTKDGQFRRFGFIGYRNEEDAANAVQHFNRTFINTARLDVRNKRLNVINKKKKCFVLILCFVCFVRAHLKVSLAKAVGDDSIPRPWSRFSRGSSAYQRREQELKQKEESAKDAKSKKEGPRTEDGDDSFSKRQVGL